jgi:hypothetical protein
MTTSLSFPWLTASDNCPVCGAYAADMLSHACTRRMAPVATEIDARPLAWQTISLDRATDYPPAPPTLGWTAPIALAIAGALLYLTTVLLPSLP